MRLASGSNCHPGTSRSKPSASARESGAMPPRQGMQCCSLSAIVNSSLNAPSVQEPVAGILSLYKKHSVPDGAVPPARGRRCHHSVPGGRHDSALRSFFLLLLVVLFFL